MFTRAVVPSDRSAERELLRRRSSRETVVKLAAPNALTSLLVIRSFHTVSYVNKRQVCRAHVFLEKQNRAVITGAVLWFDHGDARHATRPRGTPAQAWSPLQELCVQFSVWLRGHNENVMKRELELTKAREGETSKWIIHARRLG
jgi:hypothetical protein